MFSVFRKRKLTPRTHELIERLFAQEWFTHLGEPINGNVHAVKDWSEAIVFINDPRQISLEAQGELTVQLHRQAPKKYQNWNDIAVCAKEAVVSKIDERVAGLTALSSTDRILVRDEARWSIVGACIESEYADVVPFNFCLAAVEWYPRGHFPCGWFGTREKGKLAVF